MREKKMKRERKEIPTKLAGIIRAGLLSCLLLLVFACATSSGTQAIDQAVSQNNFEGAVAAIVNAQEGKKPLYNERNAVSLFLDKGFLEYYAKNHPNSAQDLLEAERLIEENFTRSVTANMLAYIANDNVKEYTGEDFEDIYLSVFNALNFYKQGNIDGALVEIRKLTQSSGKLDMLSRKYEAGGKSVGDWLMEQLNKIGFTLNEALPQGDPVMFNNSALAQFLGGLFYLADGNRDSARISFAAAERAFADNSKVYTHPVPKAFAEAQAVPAGKARLNIIAFTGLSPVKTEGVFTQNWPFMQNPELREPIFKLPVFRDRTSDAGRVHVTVNEEQFELELLENMGAVVKETYNAKFANQFLKSWIRVLFLYAAGDIAATEASKTGGGELARMASANGVRIFAYASEGADIRMGRFLPNMAYVGGLNLDPGTYTVTIRFPDGTTEEIPVDVKANGLNLIDAVCLR
jgi:hypothetical protein